MKTVKKIVAKSVSSKPVKMTKVKPSVPKKAPSKRSKPFMPTINYKGKKFKQM